MPDDVSKKSLKVLDKKLEMLAEHADFHVNINSVLGSGVNQSGGRAARGPSRRRTGFHLHGGHHPRRQRTVAAALGPREQAIFDEIMSLGQEALSPSSTNFSRTSPADRKTLALPRRLALPLYLRGRAGALLLAAARLSRHSDRGIHRRTPPPRILYAQIVRAAVHGFLRPPSGRHGQLARATDI